MWTFQLPTRVSFGDGVAGEAAARAAEYGQRPIIVTDATLAGLPGVQALIASFAGAPVFSEVEPNPTVANVDALARLIRSENADVLVAIGGGSPLDCAKAAACLAPSGVESIRAFHSEGQKLDPRRLPLIALPTTAGTGSEVTPFAVLDDREKEIKGPIAAEALYPTWALVDPELTHSLPRFVTAATALDALCHAIEGYWSKNHQPICDLLAKEAARLIFQHFERVMEDPGDREARAALSYAALIAGMAFQLPKNAMVHACSYPLSNRYHLCHGAACAFTLEFAIRLNAPHTGGRLDAFAAACGLDSPEAMAETIHRFKRLGGLPCTLAEAGIPESAIEAIIAESFHPLINNNPKTVTPDDLQAMYESLCV
jgi:alcohol dehydrogenase